MRIVWAMDFGNQAPKRRCRCTRNQSLKSLWTQGNAVSAPPITGIRRNSYTSNFIKNAWRPIITCWRAQSWYKVPPPLIFHFNHSLFAIFCHRSVMNRSVGVYDQIWGCWVAVNFLLGVFMSQWLRFLRSLVLSPVSNCCNYLSLCHKKWDYCSSTDREVSGQWTLFKAFHGFCRTITITATSALRCPAAPGRTASPAQLLRPTGFLCGRSVGLEFLAADNLRDPIIGGNSFRQSLKTFLFATYWCI